MSPENKQSLFARSQDFRVLFTVLTVYFMGVGRDGGAMGRREMQRTLAYGHFYSYAQDPKLGSGHCG